MKRKFGILILFLLVSISTWAQDIKIRFDEYGYMKALIKSEDPGIEAFAGEEEWLCFDIEKVRKDCKITDNSIPGIKQFAATWRECTYVEKKDIPVVIKQFMSDFELIFLLLWKYPVLNNRNIYRKYIIFLDQNTDKYFFGDTGRQHAK